LCYTIDLSTAFDILRKDILELHHGKIPDYLLWTLGDFLTDRRYEIRDVEHNNVNSSLEKLQVVCVQGSVLGPVLFNMYLHDIVEHFGDATIFTYADDSYVCVTKDTTDQAISAAETVIPEHISFLKTRGMVVNQSKTELIIFNNDKTPPLRTVRVGNDTISTKTNIKALGVLIDNKLSCYAHVHSVTQRLKGLMAGLWIIASKLDKGMLIRIITAQIFSILYYSCQLWLTPSLSYNNIKRIESAHYTALRVALKDGKRKLSRSCIDDITQRMYPRLWMKFSALSFFIKVTRDCMPTRLKLAITQNAYQEIRKIGQLFSRDTSNCKNGHKAMKNWIGLYLRQINLQWFNLQMAISYHNIRIQLK